MKVTQKLWMLFLSFVVVAGTLSSCNEEEDLKNADPIESVKPYASVEGFQDQIAYPLPAEIHAADWMAQLPGDTKICNLTIPGTHDTLTGMGFYSKLLRSIFNLTAISQVTTLQMQLECGVRFFDIRPVVSTDTITHQKVLRTSHGISEIAVTLDEATNMMASYLKQHPGEMIIMKLQHDNGTEDQAKWTRLMEAYFLEHADLFCTWKPDMTLDDARGLILPMIRYDDEIRYSKGVYIDWADESADLADNNPVNLLRERLCMMGLNPEKFSEDGSLDDDVYPCYVQDYYKSDKPERLTAKWTAVKAMLEDAAEVTLNNTQNIWIINHCSAYTEVSPRGYCKNAEDIHPKTIETIAALQQKNPASRFGIVVVDFAGCDNLKMIINGGTPYTSCYLYGNKPMSQSLINHLIESNFKK